jgi:hypothetical protein
MADAPELHVPPVPPIPPSARHSTLEPLSHPPQGPYLDSEGLQVQQPIEYYKPALSPNSQYAYAENLSAGNLQALPVPGVDAETSDWRKRRICGMSLLVFWILIALLVLGGIGAIVGGVVGGMKAKSSSGSQPAAAAQSASSTSNSGATSATTTTAASSTTSSAAPTASPLFQSDMWYRLTNSYLGPTLALDILDNDGLSSTALNMSATGEHEGQYWQIRAIPSSTNSSSSSSGSASLSYWLACWFLGQQKRLEVADAASILPHMAPANDTSPGQMWQFTEWADGTWALSNGANGPGWNMSTYSDTHTLFMRHDAEDSGQHWSVASIQKIADSAWQT